MLSAGEYETGQGLLNDSQATDATMQSTSRTVVWSYWAARSVIQVLPLLLLVSESRISDTCNLEAVASV